jgi:hypothetical protein
VLSDLKTKSKQTRESVWGFNKLQEFSFAKENKEKVISKEVSKNEIEEVNKQPVTERVEETTTKEEEKQPETSKTFLGSFIETKDSFGESVRDKKKNLGDLLSSGIEESEG